MDKSFKDNSKPDKSILQLLLKIFEITFSSSSENESTISTDAKQKALNTLIDSEMKNVETKKFLSIQNISAEDFDFHKSIKEDLKYLLVNFKSEFLFLNIRNNLIRLLCQIIESIKEENIEPKMLNVLYVIITSALFNDTEKQRQTLISFIFQLTTMCPQEANNVFNSKIYLKMIKEEKENTMNETYDIVMKLLKEVKNYFEDEENEDLLNETVNHLNELYSWNNIDDDDKKHKLIYEVVSFIKFSCKDNLKGKLNISMYIDIFYLFPFKNNCTARLKFIIKNINQGNCSDFEFYDIPFSKIHYQVQSILMQPSFREKVYLIFSSKIIRDYYQLKEEYLKIQRDNMITNSKNECISQVNIMSEVIINEYNKFCVNLNDSTFRDNFFNNTICVGRIAKSLKAFTTRYLQIVINYSGIDKDNLPKNLTADVKSFSQEDLAIINKDKEIRDIKKEDIQELIYIQVLKSFLLLVIIHELNHYVRRLSCINEDVAKSITDRRNIKNRQYEGGEHMFEIIFGVDTFSKMSYEQALLIYNNDNWNGKLSKFIGLFKENDNSNFASVLKFMEIRKKRWHCCEGYND